MIQPHTIVRIERLEARTLVEVPYDLRHIHAGLHIEVGERRLRIVETARVLPLEPVHHIPHHALRRENLIRLLRRDIVEDISFRIRGEIVRELPALPHKLPDCIIEHHRIEEMTVEMPFMRLIADLLPLRVLLVVVAAVAQHAERMSVTPWPLCGFTVTSQNTSAGTSASKFASVVSSSPYAMRNAGIVREKPRR